MSDPIMLSFKKWHWERFKNIKTKDIESLRKKQIYLLKTNVPK